MGLVFFGADDGTFVAACSALAVVRSANGLSRSAAAPLPQKAGLFGDPVFGGFKSTSEKENRYPRWGTCFLVRMMGLEPTGYCYH